MRMAFLMLIIYNLKNDRSNREAGPTSASSTCVGILEREAPVAQAILPVNLHTQQVDLVRFIHDAGNTIYFKIMVLV